jgi:hypothetical protein
MVERLVNSCSLRYRILRPEGPRRLQLVISSIGVAVSGRIGHMPYSAERVSVGARSSVATYCASGLTPVSDLWRSSQEEHVAVGTGQPSCAAPQSDRCGRA